MRSMTLALGLFLQRLLLDRGQRGIDDQQLGVLLLGQRRRFPRPGPCRTGWRGGSGAAGRRVAADDVDTDRLGQARGLVEPGVERAHGPSPARSGTTSDGALAARDAAIVSCD